MFTVLVHKYEESSVARVIGMGACFPGTGIGGFVAAAVAMGSVGGSIEIATSFGAAGAGLSGFRML
ncbi:hypothetical protein Droror1_Dr00020263, partial [Drosera rotundifolia]